MEKSIDFFIDGASPAACDNMGLVNRLYAIGK